MHRTYGVVWREGEGPIFVGKLELLPRALRLEGRDASKSIPYDRIVGVRVGRAAAERLDNRPSVVVEPRGGTAVTIATVAQSSLVGEIAERLAELQLGAQRPRRLVVVLPLKPGARDAVRTVLEAGPPFDPAAIPGLDRHEVFLSGDEAVFLFDSNLGADALRALVSQPGFWQSAAAWRDHVAGPPRLAEEVFSWTRVVQNGDVFYLPTPGPGDSDGGDIF
jgi:hypothetical protein